MVREKQRESEREGQGSREIAERERAQFTSSLVQFKHNLIGTHKLVCFKTMHKK